MFTYNGHLRAPYLALPKPITHSLLIYSLCPSPARHIQADGISDRAGAAAAAAVVDLVFLVAFQLPGYCLAALLSRLTVYV